MTKTRDLLSLHDIEPAFLQATLDLAADLKRAPAKYENALHRKCLALVFEKPSLRTRTTFEAGMVQMGGAAIYLAPADIGMGSREPVEDVARNLERWVNGIAARTFAHQTVVELATHARIPVINALSDATHPCQALADLQTLREHWGESLNGRTIAYVGDGNNVCHSLAYACAAVGMSLRIATPRGYEPRADVLEEAKWDADRAGFQVQIEHTHDPSAAVAQADAVYTDAWASMGQEAQAEERREAFRSFQVNAELMSQARSSALFLHCLPAHRGEEVTAEVLTSERSVVYDQAENRLHAQKALLVQLLG